jgi:hypothetical protein
MNTQLNPLINIILKMGAVEQLELIRVISQSLQHNHLSSPDFWQPKTLEEMIPAQNTRNIADLGADFLPENESADDMIEYIYQQRREDRLLQKPWLK